MSTDPNAGQVIDLGDPHREAPGAEPTAETAAATVLLFDPATPTNPRRELAENFDPAIHVRWEARPAVAPLKLDTLLPEDEAKLLVAAKLDNLKAILVGGKGALQAAGLDPRVADELLRWVSGRAATAYAQAEIDAEPKPEPLAAKPEPSVESKEVPAAVEAAKGSPSPLAPTANGSGSKAGRKGSESEPDPSAVKATE